MTANNQNILDPQYADPMSAIGVKLPPNSMEAEEAVLGCILLIPSAMAVAAGILVSDDFYHTPHRVIYRHCLKIYEEGGQTDLYTVTTRIQDRGEMDSIGSTGTLANLVDRTISGVNLDKYCALVKEKSIRRRYLTLSYSLAERAFDTLTPVQRIGEALSEQLQDIPSTSVESPQSRAARRFDRLIERVREIKMGPYSPGLRDDLLLQLAKDTKRSVEHLEKIYFKSLLSDGDGPFMSLAELRAKVGDRSESWVINGLFPAGRTTLFHAPAGTGKTKLLLSLALKSINGESWDDFQICSPKKVLLIVTDESEGDLLANLSVMGYPENSPNLRIKTTWSVEYIPSLIAQAREWQPDLILIDSLTSVSKFSMISENNTEYARPLLELADLAEDIGSHIITIHHSTKGPSGERDARGSSALAAAVSQVMMLERAVPANQDPSDTSRVLRITKSRSRRPASYMLRFDGDSHDWDFVGELGASEPMGEELSTRDAIFALLRANLGIRFSYSDLAQRLGTNINTARKVAGKLHSDGLVNRCYHERMCFVFLGEASEAPPVIRSQGGIRPGSVPDHSPDQSKTTENQGLQPEVIPDHPFGDNQPDHSPAVKTADQRITSQETTQNQGIETDPPTDPPTDPVLIHPSQADHSDQVDQWERSLDETHDDLTGDAREYAWGDVVKIRYPMPDGRWEVLTGTISEINRISATVHINPSSGRSAGISDREPVLILRKQIIGWG